jgi:hypothetical protein
MESIGSLNTLYKAIRRTNTMTYIGEETEKQLEAKPKRTRKPKAEEPAVEEKVNSLLSEAAEGLKEMAPQQIKPSEELQTVSKADTEEAVPAHILEKAAFINSILENARNTLLGTVKDMPEYWTGRELRMYVVDYFNKYIAQQVPPATKQRYKKDCAVRPLL